MARQDMKRHEITENRQKNDVSPVPEIQEKAKYENKRVDQITEEDPISDVYPVIDNDLARDNIENDMTAADLQDL